MALRHLGRRLLIGADHGDGEQSKVFGLLRDYRIPAIGIEITPGDLRNTKLSQIPHKRYWASLKSYYRNVGTEVVALDHPLLDEPDVQRLGDAWSILSSSASQEDAERFLVTLAVAKSAIELRGPSRSPLPSGRKSFSQAELCMMDVAASTLTLLREKGEARIIEEFAELNAKRDAHMLELIRDRCIPVAVVGHGHSAVLSRSLPGYEHVQLTSLSDEEATSMLRPARGHSTPLE